MGKQLLQFASSNMKPQSFYCSSPINMSQTIVLFAILLGYVMGNMVDITNEYDKNVKETQDMSAVDDILEKLQKISGYNQKTEDSSQTITTDDPNKGDIRVLQEY